MKTILSTLILLVTGFTLCFASDSLEDVMEQFLKKHLKAGTVNNIELTLVDYKKWNSDPGYQKALKILKKINVKSIKEKDKMAFWINAYNLLTIKMILDNYPVDGIKDIGGFFTSVWDKPVIKILGKEYTLNFIEHEILRPLGDPRIHFAIVCASLSCPNLRTEAYTSELLDKQLDDQTKNFISNNSKGVFYTKDKTLKISQIFKWFKEDFESSGGVKVFLKKYLPKTFKIDIKNVEINYLDYDWSLNDFSRYKNK